jgi:hypothetical protein
MARVNLGTTTSHGQPINRRIFKTTNDELIFFAYVDSNIKYKISTDDGVTWEETWNTVVSTNSVLFTGYIDTTNDIYIVYRSSAGNPTFIKGTYSAGAWSWGSPVEIYAGDSPARGLSITKRSNGDLWVSNLVNTFDTIGTYYSTDGGSSWNRVTLSYSFFTQCYILNKGTYIWLIALTNDGKVKQYEYDASWSAATDVVSSGATHSANGLGSVKISDSEIYFSIMTSSGITIYAYNGSWDSGTLLSDNANDNSPVISNIGGSPVVVWSDYDGSNYNISYRKWNGVSWNTQINITDDVDIDEMSTVMDNDDYHLYIDYATGTSPNFTIYFDNFQNLQIEDVVNTFTFVRRELYDTNNKINFIKRVLKNITNDFRSAIIVFSDSVNYINTVISSIFDVDNKFNSKRREIYDITNDIRFLKSFQRAGNFGFQSLGKSYIYVYIDSIAQTDAIVDSIKINRGVNSASSASFTLGRAYDSSKPSLESVVEIKYNNWTIFKGYLVSIKPTDNPDTMSIECQDEYWKQNRTNKYFFVGHTPVDNQELYYNTIKSAILSEFSWDIDLGDFVPQTINAFGVGSSDVLSDLLSQAGNFGLYYDVDMEKKSWNAGNGSIVNITRQSIGTNIGLYQLISHSFDEDASKVINKLRVQMGDKIIRKLSNAGSTRTYSGYYYSSFETYATPAWNSTYERLSINSPSTGFGFDYHKPEHAYLYNDIYKKYNLPWLDSDLESWTDWKAPQVYIYGDNLFNAEQGLLDSGYTIDYENGLLILNDRIFQYNTDSYGKLLSTRAPRIKVNIWKKKYYSYTTSPSDDPETDISSPLQFFTDKVGDYPETIFDILELSNLSIQEGYTYVDENGETQIIPSWDDTAFARDYAYWQLSNSAYKKINGSITITLDTMLFYDIKLNSRIYIEGITEEAMNINSITYDLNNFTVTLDLENHHAYKRTISFQSRGE